MFTGLIQDVGVIRRVNRQRDIARLWIQTGLSTEGFRRGESIAVDGVCLSVVEAGSGGFEVELSPETMGRTTLGEARIGRRVNLERALRPSDRLGGHLVTGHIDGIGKIQRRDKGIHHLEFWIQIPPSIGRYIVEKGSVAVDGVSLTVARLAGLTP
ncbi:MAG: riboflavin synthase, partial [Thermodesulfobacteriota bacterium]